MQFYSTNRQSPKVALQEAVMDGLAHDGGLFMPERIPAIPRAFFNNIGEMGIREIAYVVANMILGEDIDSADIKRIVSETFAFDVPLAKLDDQVFSLELFHGPTLAFKDVGARFLARVISHYGLGNDEKVKVLVATSGDSGGAVANGFLNIPGVEVYVLYPSGALSAVQRAQFSIPNSNVFPIEVIGTFDDCQRLVKTAFTDKELINAPFRLTSANSINICRLLPQTFYFFHAYAQLKHLHPETKDVVISVPCGNLGNLTAGLLAWKMGLPVKRFVVANNRNSVTVDYLSTGEFSPKRVVRTIANAMDVGNPSNIHRILDIFGGDFNSLTTLLKGFSYSDQEIAGAMADVYSIYHYLLDPHGATAYLALRDALTPGEFGIFLETAHPSKFPRAVQEATGVTFKQKKAAEALPYQIAKILPSLDQLKKILWATGSKTAERQNKNNNNGVK